METIYQKDNYTIKKDAHGEADLWVALCPFAVSRDVRRDLGIAISSDDNYTWLLVFDQENKCVGIAAVEFCNGSKAKFRHAYVKKDHRNKGLYTTLLQLREKLAIGKTVVITAAADSLPMILNAGYIKTGTRGKYTTMEKQL